MSAPTPRDPSCPDDSPVVLRPHPAGTIQALTALGYSSGAAVADLVDNSLAAGAGLFEVDLHWAGAEGSSVAMLDDGRGMSPAQLRTAMTVGAGGLDVRAEGDLGRFGMGLKTASFSQCRQLTVASRTSGDQPWASVTWDLDHVQRVGDWEVLLEPPTDTAPELERHTSRLAGPGTVVLWRRLTTLALPGAGPADRGGHRHFLQRAGEIEGHLSMVFCRYLQGRPARLRLSVNGNEVGGWDPFDAGSLPVSALARESPRSGVSIQGFVMPHPRRFVLDDGYTPDRERLESAGGPRGWLEQQGFYIYRNDRLIVGGDWLGLGRREQRYRLARLAVDLDTDQDTQWGVDIRKTSATIPAQLRSHLTRLARITQNRAEAVERHRGAVVRAPGGSGAHPADVTWQQIHQHGRVEYRLNRQHPLIRHLLDAHPQLAPDLRAVLALCELTLPVTQIRQNGEGSPTGTETVTGAADPPSEALAEAGRRILAAMSAAGIPQAEARRRLATMPPFCDHPGAVADLTQPARQDHGGATTEETP